MRDNPSAERPRGFALHAATGTFILLVLAFVAYIWITGQSRGAAVGWLMFWCTICTGLLAVPGLPLVGTGVYLVLAYGMSSHAPELDIMLSMRILDGAALLALAGWLLGRRRDIARPALVRRPIKLVGGLLFVWVGISLAVSILGGTPAGTFPRHDPSGYFQAAVMLLVTSDSVRSRRDCTVLSGLIVATIIGRAGLQGLAGIYLESYIATLLIMGAPIALLGMFTARTQAARSIFGMGAATTLGLLMLTKNRAAAVAALAVLATLAWQSGRYVLGRWLVMGLVVVAVAVAVAFAPSAYLDRFRVLLDPTMTSPTAALDKGTANERLELWSAAWDMAMDRPVFGVGPGNYPAVAGVYLPGKEPIAAHSNYLQVLAETGFPGLVLYLGFFLGVLLMLERLRRKGNHQIQRRAAQMLELSLIAYLAGGIFNSRHDLVFAYVLAGWAMALHKIEFDADVDFDAGNVPGGARSLASD